MEKIFSEKPIRVMSPANYNGAAGTTEWISLSDFRHIQFLITTGAWAGGSAAVTLQQARDAAGTGAKALGFTKQWNDVAQDGDYVETPVVGDTFDLDTANKQYVVEMDAAELDTNDGFGYISLQIASPGANNDFYSAVANLSGARYEQESQPDVLS